MNTTLLNNRTKFGAKIFRRYQVITFYVFNWVIFLAAPCSIGQALVYIGVSNLQLE